MKKMNLATNSNSLGIFQHSYVKKTLVAFKLFYYFAVITYVQVTVRSYFTPGTSEYGQNNNHIICWLLYEVVIFYFSIFALIIFLILSRFKSFRTLRERVGYGGNMRYKIDFLDFCKDDIHWF